MVETRSKTSKTKPADYSYTALIERGEGSGPAVTGSSRVAKKATKKSVAKKIKEKIEGSEKYRKGKEKESDSIPTKEPVDREEENRVLPPIPIEEPEDPRFGGSPREAGDEGPKLSDFPTLGAREVGTEESSYPHVPEPDFSNGNSFWPSVILGAYEKEGKNPIQRADEKIEQWEKILEEHKINLPAAVPHLEALFSKAKQARAAMGPASDNVGEEAEQDLDPDLEKYHQTINIEGRLKAVSDRIVALSEALRTSKFEPERINISGAIKAYQQKELEYSTKYTLFWNGEIVDRTDTYGEFVVDRQKRLDRYAKKEPGWLWYETPLCEHPSESAVAMRCGKYPAQETRNGLAGFQIAQGFWKRSGLVSRLATTDEHRQVPDCGEDGPKLIYESMLDSGATFPTLFKSDLEELGIDPEKYAAQSVVNMHTFNGNVNNRLFELFVEVCTEKGDGLVNPHNPVRPDAPPYIGGLLPVTMHHLRDSPEVDENGVERSIRLSGIMAFHAAYVSTTPSQNLILLGENRNDVLGAQRTPAAKRWTRGMKPRLMADDKMWDFMGDPMITFSHLKGELIDRDTGPGVSEVISHLGDKKHESTRTMDPRGEYQKRAAQAMPPNTGGPGAATD
ncbi:MAG: hypothetical protein M1827_006637 [Pycnora praestabilis]|nr:MAG: hypothetical protein M1827_006637 [Pycnora praestabilis]